MKVESSFWALVAVLGFILLVYLAFRLVEFLLYYRREKRYIFLGLKRSEKYSEYAYWRKELYCLRLCWLPFITPQNAPAVYDFIFQKKQQKEMHPKGIFSLLAPSAIGAMLCAVCLCSASWAWFNVATVSGVQTLQSATYTVTVTATSQTGTEPQSVTPGENNSSGVVIPETQTFNITLKAGGTATKGYCTVLINGTVYQTPEIAPNAEFKFSVKAGSAVASVTVAPHWGSLPETAQNILTPQQLVSLAERATAATAPQNSPESAKKPAESSVQSSKPAAGLKTESRQDKASSSAPAQNASNAESAASAAEAVLSSNAENAAVTGSEALSSDESEILSTESE